MIVHGIQRNAFLSKSILLSVAVIILLNGRVVGQLKQFALPSNPAASKNSKSTISSARSLELQPRQLPFWEDFSATPVDVAANKKSNYPVDSLWVNNKTVWINNGMGINPPSLNVATFDGLDSAFLPYSNQVLPNGLRDSLVSQPIKMGEADVTLAERSSVYLSFFYQWQGNGEAPDATDYLLVEFKNSAQKWEPVMTIFPKSSFSRTVFYDTLIKVEGDQFFHDSFQFRIKNYGRLSGPYDTWNVDYIYLNKNRSITDTDFPDQAVSSTLTSLFDKYQSIPYDHFLNSSAIQSPKFDVFNGLNDFTDLTYLTEATFLNYDSGGRVRETFISNLGVNDTSAINDDGSGIIFPLEKRTVTMQYVPSASDANQFDPKSDSVWVKLKVKLFTGDTFDPKTSGLANDYDLNYLPIDFRANDTISADYFLKDYYAYDDGIAEYAAGLTQAGNRAAILFEMLTSEPDTLVGIDIYVPDYGLSSNLTTDFYVYNDVDGVPGDVLYSIPSVSVQRKGLNAFQRIRIGEPFLVSSRFYVGWRAPVGGVLKLGLDYNNDASEKIYVNTNGSWVNNADINGSIMIRPVFGNGEIILGVAEESTVGVFPNPNDGEFNITGDFDKLYIVNRTGQEVPFQLQSNGTSHKVNLQHPAAGLYLIKMQQGNKLRSAKIIVK